MAPSVMPLRKEQVRSKRWTTVAGPRLTDEQLAFILGWERDEVRKRFEMARVSYRRHLYEWRAVRMRLSPRQITDSRERILVIRTSKRWLSGYPKLVAEWDNAKNGHIVPLDVAFGSKRRFWWRCPKGPDHQWQASVGNRTRLGNQCPFCQHKKVSVTNSLATLAPNVAREWHPTKNGALTPNHITSAASRAVWWKCSGCQGSWQATVGNRTGRNSGCPPCSTRRRVAIQSRPKARESLAHVAPHLVREWHPEKNAPMTPRDVSWGSRERVWWRCSRDPSHEWQIAISNRSRERLPSGCPFCWRLRQRTTIKPPPYENSLAHRVPTLARQWHPDRNGKLTPRDVSIGSGRRVWWRCTSNHVWSTPVRARAMAGNNCPDCRRERGRRLRAA